MQTLAPQGLTGESLFGWTRERVAKEKKNLEILERRLAKPYEWPMTQHDRYADTTWARELKESIKHVEYMHNTGTPWPED